MLKKFVSPCDFLLQQFSGCDKVFMRLLVCAGNPILTTDFHSTLCATVSNALQ